MKIPAPKLSLLLLPNRTTVFTTGDARPDQEWNDKADEPSWQR